MDETCRDAIWVVRMHIDVYGSYGCHGCIVPLHSVVYTVGYYERDISYIYLSEREI